MENRSCPTSQTNNISVQPNFIGVQTSGLTENTLQTSINSTTNLTNSLNLQSNIGLSVANIINHSTPDVTVVNSIRNSKVEEIPHNLVLQRSVNNIDNMYRSQSLHLRNGNHESLYSVDTDISPSQLNNHESYVTRRLNDFDEEDHSVPQQRDIVTQLPTISEARLNDVTRIVKPAPLQARLLQVDTDFKDLMRRPTFYVIPDNPEKKFVLIKNEATDTVQVCKCRIVIGPLT